MKLVELFCGSGGFSLGAHRAGFDVAAAYDIDEILTSSYSANFPDTALHRADVTHLTGERIRNDVAGEIFGLIGGPPCQGFSSIGKRASDDPRRELLWHFFRLVNEVRPQFFIMENVQGLAFTDARPVLDRALELVAGDYDILTPQVWNASDFGAATSRNRLFAIGVLRERGTPITKEDIEQRKREAVNVKDAISDLAGAIPIAEDPALKGFDQWKIKFLEQPSEYALNLRSVDNTFTGHKLTAHTSKVVKRFNAVTPGATEKVGRHPRLKWDGLCPTLRAGTGADKGSFQSVRPIHPTEDRVITVREAARLQGFPDAHIFHPTIWHSFRMIGNSVSPVMAEAVCSAVRDRLAAN